MTISPLVWAVTLAGIALVFLIDFIVVGRRPHVVSMREAGISVLVYVALAVVFGFGIWFTAGPQFGFEFFAGYITELSLSVDNLFVFVVIMSSFAVPQKQQLKVLQLGIIGALILRGIFIAVGAVLLSYFNWLFFVFGVFLLYTAWKLATEHGTEGEPQNNKILKRIERVLPTTTEYHEASSPSGWTTGRYTPRSRS
jgi:tellurite resistance protein TerC